MEEEETRKLVHRLNRIQGQIEAVKKSIENEEPDCTKVIQLVKAANNAMKKFGEAYVTTHFSECLANGEKSPQEMEKDMQSVINSAFSM